MDQLDIVIPCYNPAAGWKETIIHNITLIQQQLPGIELFLYLVDDGSISGVKQEDFCILKKSLPNLSLISYKQNIGKGYALRRGIQETNHDLCIYTDVDFPYTIESFIQLYKVLARKENDIVVGVRNESYYAHLSTDRILISKFLRLLNHNILHLPVTDTQCGIKGFNQKGRQLFLSTKLNRYLFDLEFIFLASKNHHIKLGSVPVQLRSGIIFQKIGLKILTTEAINLLKISLSRARGIFK